MRGQCGTEGFSPLPCVDNTPATTPASSQFRQLLVDTCGIDYLTGPVCCDESQLDDLVSQVKRAEAMIVSCPACWHNFLQFWCSFTCSPDQSTFVNITSAKAGDEKGSFAVTSADYWVGDHFGSQFFDSCKDVKFSASNGYAMDFIGGGAKDWQTMVRYMGRKRPLIGSPFQIDFPPLREGEEKEEKEEEGDLVRYDADGKSCNDTDPAYRCACVDCQAVCPILEPTPAEKDNCHVGSLRCWSFAMLMIYLMVLVLSASLLLGRNQRIGRWMQRFFGMDVNTLRRPRGLYERLALSEEDQDALQDDDDDEVEETLLDPDSRGTHRYWLNAKLQGWFYYQGLLCARYPWVVILVSLLCVTLCSLGWSRFAVERDPVKLWVSPSSTALAQKKHFDEHFTPFYRTTQLFFVSENASQPVMTGQRLQHLFQLEDDIRLMRSDAYGYTLQDVCFHPNGDACIVQSVTRYWDSDVFDPSSWKSTFEQCASQPSLCLPDFQQPIKPDMVLGGYQEGDYLSAKAMIVTYVLTNSVDAHETAKAEDWENSLLTKILKNIHHKPEWEGVRISYSTESSIEKELNQSSNTDANTVIISYVVMFLYASVALGRIVSYHPRRLVVDSKFSLGICGILIVIFSVSSAVGLFSLTGQKITLIIAEVIPFLVLAVGVDNIFILCHEYARRVDLGEEESIEERAAKTLGRMGPSILLSSLSETIAFGLGTFVTMPAVSSFATVASIAVFVDFVLQVTCFVSCLVLDAYRQQNRRIDCVPCVQIETPEVIEKESLLQTMVRDYYVPAILRPKARYVISMVFLGLFSMGLSLLPQLPMGLDQRIALPSDSYLVQYFNDMDTYFNVGPPVYFVVKGANLTRREEQKKICGRFPSCHERSLANVLEQERRRSHVSYIGEPTSIWYDDFMNWLNPTTGCCRLKNEYPRRRHPPGQQEAAASSSYGSHDWELCSIWDDDRDCTDCNAHWDVSMQSFPEGKDFLDFFDLWITMAPDEDCPLGGKAAYGDAIVADHDRVTLDASHFRTFHTPLRSQQDFIAAYGSARRIAEGLSEELGLDVYPYSVFYIFFEQYSSIVAMAFEILGLAVLSIFAVTSLLLGSFRCGALVMTVVIMILVDVVGVMVLWGVSLNAVSLVNLVICVGISVEFCCHIARGFMVAKGHREQRAGQALMDVGSSASLFWRLRGPRYLRCITLECVSTLSEYSERCMFLFILGLSLDLAIVVLGALHGLVLLPVLLCLLGGDGMVLADVDEDGFAWSANSHFWRGLGSQHHSQLLVEDNESSDQVLITDVPANPNDSVTAEHAEYQANGRMTTDE
ncbi:patched family-domain-containing protein [Mycotypha africana]|uniref:patched family-domain-containing protein n=1 Tax=Mycotypha africana TaxID=64632 RepID=UPI00230178D8|nr:patched family-domain-containing protein [Mycotypha africana]KAI8973755.1 patched family-domain-containing protein [Mycotypha africana]